MRKIILLICFCNAALYGQRAFFIEPLMYHKADKSHFAFHAKPIANPYFVFDKPVYDFNYFFRSGFEVGLQVGYKISKHTFIVGFGGSNAGAGYKLHYFYDLKPFSQSYSSYAHSGSGGKKFYINYNYCFLKIDSLKAMPKIGFEVYTILGLAIYMQPGGPAETLSTFAHDSVAIYPRKLLSLHRENTASGGRVFLGVFGAGLEIKRKGRNILNIEGYFMQRGSYRENSLNTQYVNIRIDDIATGQSERFRYVLNSNGSGFVFSISKRFYIRKIFKKKAAERT